MTDKLKIKKYGKKNVKNSYNRGTFGSAGHQPSRHHHLHNLWDHLRDS